MRWVEDTNPNLQSTKKGLDRQRVERKLYEKLKGVT